MLSLPANRRLIKHCAALHKKLPPQFAQLLQRARTERLHAKASVPQTPAPRIHCGARLRRDRNQPVVFKKPDRLRAQLVQARRSQAHRRADRITPILAAQACETAETTSPMVRAIGPIAPRIENGPTHGGRCPTPGIRPGVGFSEQMPGKVRRHPYRPAAVAAQSRCRHPRRNRRRLATARSTRRSVRGPRDYACVHAADSPSRRPSEIPGSSSCPESALPPHAAVPPPPHPRAESRPCAAGSRFRTDIPRSRLTTSP